MAKKVSKPGEPDKPLFPLVFCRQCGTAYYRVKLSSKTSTARALLAARGPPRRGRRRHAATLISTFPRTAPWPRGDGQELLERAAGVHEGDDRGGRGARAARCAGRSARAGLRRRRRSNRLRREGSSGGADSAQLPVLPGAVVRGGLHQEPAVRAQRSWPRSAWTTAARRPRSSRSGRSSSCRATAT